MPKAFENIGTVILAGGNSSRMGMPKSLLPFNKDKTFLERLINTFSWFGCKHIVVVMNAGIRVNEELNWDFARNGNVQFVNNPSPENGRLYSIRMGLREMPEMDHVFLQNIDGPFTDGTLLRSLLESADQDSYFVPCYKGKGGHPILLPRMVVKHISNMENSNGNLKQVLGKFTRKNVGTSDPLVLSNINTPEDYYRYFGTSPFKKEEDLV